jgi:hypothetical protein
MLGRVSLATTQIYTHVSIQKLREVHEKTHPARLYRRPADAPQASGPNPEEHDPDHESQQRAADDENRRRAADHDDEDDPDAACCGSKI